MSSGAFVCSERGALVEGHACPSLQEASLSLPTCYIISSPKRTPRRRTEIQGSGSCVGTRARQQGDRGEKLGEKGSGRKGQEGKMGKGDLCLMGKEIAICRCPKQPTA